MARIPSGGRDLEQEKADKAFDFAKKVYERSGANIGPRKPMSEDMKRRIGEEVDKVSKDKEIARKTPEDVARTNASRAYDKGPKAQEAFQSQMKNESPELKDVARIALQKEYKVPRGGGGSGGVSDTRELQLGSDLDPKSMMKREGMKKGGSVKSSASSRGDGIAQRGKTKGRMV
jgi:hypothetical protein